MNERKSRQKKWGSEWLCCDVHIFQFASVFHLFGLFRSSLRPFFTHSRLSTLVPSQQSGGLDFRDEGPRSLSLAFGFFCWLLVKCKMQEKKRGRSEGTKEKKPTSACHARHFFVPFHSLTQFFCCCCAHFFLLLFHHFSYIYIYMYIVHSYLSLLSLFCSFWSQPLEEEAPSTLAWQFQLPCSNQTCILFLFVEAWLLDGGLAGNCENGNGLFV